MLPGSMPQLNLSFDRAAGPAGAGAGSAATTPVLDPRPRTKQLSITQCNMGLCVFEGTLSVYKSSAAETRAELHKFPQWR